MQFSLFGAEAADPAAADLAGVLLAGGWWVRAAGAARLSVVLAAPWRADAIAESFRRLGLNPDIVPAEGGQAVRTSFNAELYPTADNWTRGANQAPPPGFELTPGGLRLWAIASGVGEGVGYRLGTDSPDSAVHAVAGAQLARLGMAAVSIANRSSPGWRITSVKRLRRLAEILGESPAGAGTDWPV